MPITLSSISGGVPDDYAGDDGYAEDKTFPNAAIENGSFVDQAIVTPEPGYVQVLSTSVSITGTTDLQISQNEITSGPLNLTFENKPSDNPFGGTSVSAGSPTITFSGTISNVFNDLYWVTRDFTDKVETTETGRNLNTSGDESLFLYKPSFLRYTYRTYTVSSVHRTSSSTTAVFTYNIIKRVVNLWEINRLTLKNIVSQQESYRSSNYPKE